MDVKYFFSNSCSVMFLVIINSTCLGLTQEEKKLLIMGQEDAAACINFSQISHQELQTRKEKLNTTINNIVASALSADNLDSRDSLLCHLLFSRELQYYAWNYIASNKERISEKHCKNILHWRIASLQLDEYKSIRAKILKSTLIVFDRPEYYDSASLRTLQNIILNDDSVGIVYLSFFREITPMIRLFFQFERKAFIFSAKAMPIPGTLSAISLALTWRKALTEPNSLSSACLRFFPMPGRSSSKESLIMRRRSSRL